MSGFPHTFATYPAGQFPASDWDDDWKFGAAIGNIACTAAGSNTIALTPSATSPLVLAYQQLAKYTFVAAANSTGPVTISVAGLTAKAVYDSTGTQISATGAILANTYYEVIYDGALNSSAGGFWLLGGQVVSASSISYRMVTAAGSVTVGPTDIRLLINKTVGAATSILLPPSAGRIHPVTVKDYKYDAATNNITFVMDGTETLDGFLQAAANANGVSKIAINGGWTTIYPLTSGGWYII